MWCRNFKKEWEHTENSPAFFPPHSSFHSLLVKYLEIKPNISFNFLLKYSSRVSLRVLTHNLSFWCCFFPIFTNFNNRLDLFLLNHKHVCALEQTYQLKSRFTSCKTTHNFLSTLFWCCGKLLWFENVKWDKIQISWQCWK